MRWLIKKKVNVYNIYTILYTQYISINCYIDVYYHQWETIFAGPFKRKFRHSR